MMRSGFRTLSTLVLLGLLAMARNAAAEDCVVDLRTAHAGSLPDGFLAAVTGRGGPAVWAALDDPTTPSGKVLAQTSAERTDSGYGRKPTASATSPIYRQNIALSATAPSISTSWGFPSDPPQQGA